MHDLGSWDEEFGALTADVCKRLVEIAAPTEAVCIPLQGSGTFAVEAAIRTLVPPEQAILVLANGAYGERMARIASQAGRRVVVLDGPTHLPPDPAAVASLLAQDPGLGYVGIVHCETTTGLLNPLAAILDVVHNLGRRALVDAMSTFGVLDVHAAHPAIDAIIAASGKGLEGLPGMGFVLMSPSAIDASRGQCDSHSLDLVDQYDYLRAHGRWRFTPPTHIVAALHEALLQYEEEGGRLARLARYESNSAALVVGMNAAGFRLYLPEELRTPIIHTFCAPDHENWDFQTFYAAARRRGFVLYPGKLTHEETFRVGCIGAVTADDMRRAVTAMSEAVVEMGISMEPILVEAGADN